MSAETSSLPTSGLAVCRVCGEALTGAVCTCAACQTPAHRDCFAYAGGCAIFSCGSKAARFDVKPPEGWREQEDGSWLIPPESASVPHRGLVIDRALEKIFLYWRTTAQLELFSVLGQTWFAAGALALALLGKWSLPALLVASLGAVVLAHANSLIGLVRMGLILTQVDQGEPMDGARRAAAARHAAIRRSRWLHVAGTALFGMGMGLGPVTRPTWAWGAVLFSALVPWFSLNPRWAIERHMLAAARKTGTELMIGPRDREGQA